MTARRKGSRNELKAVRELEERGWNVYRVKGATKFNKNVDMFGLFDILALYPKGFGLAPKMLWLQVKSNRKPSMKPFKEFKKMYCDGPTQKVEVWVYHDYKGVVKHEV